MYRGGDRRQQIIAMVLGEKRQASEGVQDIKQRWENEQKAGRGRRKVAEEDN